MIDYASQDKGGHTLREGLEKWHEKADGKCSCDYSFHMSIVEWNEETQREIQDMINEGITSFKLYMTYPAMIVDDGDLYKIIKKLNEYGCFAGVHCENAGAIDCLLYTSWDMQKRVLSLLVDNTAGVTTRVSGLFSRRGYNIDSITGGEMCIRDRQSTVMEEEFRNTHMERPI